MILFSGGLDDRSGEQVALCIRWRVAGYFRYDTPPDFAFVEFDAAGVVIGHLTGEGVGTPDP